MYEMDYAEWGPSRHWSDESRDEGPRNPVQTALDLRDNGGPRPDDN
ncbi:hypothetical protein [Mumia sp. Pv 4-285]